MGAEREAVASHHSLTMHSRHLPNKRQGLACAVDVAALIDGQISYAKGREKIVFGQIARQIMGTAKDMNIPIEWGGLWLMLKDWGHFQLPWKQYP